VLRKGNKYLFTSGIHRLVVSASQLKEQTAGRYAASFGHRVMVHNDAFNNISVISWRSVGLVEETGVLGENHRLVASQIRCPSVVSWRM
jgi:hypothetical protein